MWARARAFRGPLDAAGLRAVFHADGWWGVAAALWIGTGLVRVIGGLEKGMDYYLQNHVFWAQMTLLAAVLLLEILSMKTLVRWRAQVGRGELPHTRLAGRFARISFGWVGVWLDRRPDWAEVQGLMHDSYRLVAPRKLAATPGDEDGA